MNLKAKLAEIKNKIENDPELYFAIGIAATMGAAGSVAASYFVKQTKLDKHGTYRFSMDADVVRFAKESDRPILLKHVGKDLWHYKVIDSNE